MKKSGKMDLAECFIDGSFAAAKKGAMELEKLNVARVPRSWRLQTAMAFLSPYPHMKQVHMRLNSLKKQYLNALREQSQSD